MMPTPNTILEKLRTAPKGLRYAALALPVAVVLGYVAFWFVVAGLAERQLADWIAAQRSHGVEISHGSAETTGFPFRIAIRLDQPAARWPGGSWAGPELSLSGTPWDWRRLHWSAPGAHHVEWRGRDGQAHAATLTARHLEGWGEGGANRLPRLELGLSDGELVADGRRFLARGLLLQIAAPEEATSNGPSVGPRLPMSLDAKTVTLPPDLTTALGDTIDRLTLDLSLNGPVPPGPWPDPALQWRDAGGVVEVRHLGLAQGELSLSGEGTLAIDPEGQPEGAFAARITGFNAAIEALRKQGLMDDGTAGTVQVVLGLLANGPPGGPKTLDVPLTVQDRTLSLGPVKLFRLKAVDWFTPRGS